MGMKGRRRKLSTTATAPAKPPAKPMVPTPPATTTKPPALMPVGMPASVRDALSACTPQEQRFVMYYVGEARGNGTLAAEWAGVGKSGGRIMLASRASQMLKTPRVRDAVEAWMIAYAITPAQLTRALADLTEANIGPFAELKSDGTLHVRVLDADTWEAHKHWIKSIDADPETGRITKLVLHDSMDAYKTLAKIMRLYSDAPIVNLNLSLQRMSDDELIAYLESQRRAVRLLGPGKDAN